MNASKRIRLLSVCLLTVVGSAVAQTPPTSGLTLWLKADAITGLNNGDKVASWPDSSGSGYPAANSTVANQPTYLTSGLNGLPVVHFNDAANGAAGTTAAGQYLDSLAPVNANSNNFTAIAVFRSNPTLAGSVAGSLFLTNDTVLQAQGANGRTILFIDSFLSGSGGRFVLQSFPGSVVVSGAGQYITNTWIVADVLQDTADNRVSLFKNGQLVAARTVVGAETTPNDNNWRIGDHKNRTRGLNGDVAELLLYNRAITATERAGIESYLAAKYNLVVATNILTDTFDTPDTLDLMADIGTRQSGAAAPSSTYYSSQSGLADSVAIKNNKLSLTMADTTPSLNRAYASPGDPLGGFVVNNNFAFSVDITSSGAAAADSWAAIKAASASTLQIPVGPDGFGLLIRSTGGLTAFDGPSLMAAPSVPAASRYTVCAAFENNLVSCSVNGTLIPLDGANNLFATLTSGSAANYVSFTSHATPGDMPFVGTFDNFAFTTVPEAVLPATVILADNFTTADSTSLNNDLATRQSGVVATQLLSTVQLNGAAFSIFNNSLRITNTGNTSITNTYGVVYPAIDLRPYERSASFRLRVKISPVVATGDSWGAVKVRQSDPSKWIVNGDGIGLFVRPAGTWGLTDGSAVPLFGSVTPAATYEVELQVINNVLKAQINGTVVVSSYTIPATQTVNYVSMMSNAGEAAGGATGVAATFDDFEFAALGTAVSVPVPVIVNPAVSGGSFSFSFSSVAQAVYIVEYKNNLADPAWTALYNIIGTGGMLTGTNPTAATPKRFYRLHAP